LAEVFEQAGIPARVVGIGALMQVWFSSHAIHDYRAAERHADQRIFESWWRGMLARGVLFHPGAYENLFVSAAHGEADVDATLDAARDVADDLKRRV